MIYINKLWQYYIKLTFYYSICKVSISINLFDFYNLFSLIGLLKVYYINYKALFWVIPNYTKQLYKDLELVQSINKRLTYKILSIIDLIIILILLGIKASSHYLRQVAVTYRRSTSVVRNLKFLTPFSKFLTIKLFTYHYNLLK